jgi:hypothetical protein
MILLDQIRETKLIELARTRFDPNLSEAELKVLHDSASSEDMPEPDEKAPRPSIRPEFVRWLATDPEAAAHIDPKGIRTLDVAIPGELDLRECCIRVPLIFFRCTMESEIFLQSAETRGIFLLDSSFDGGIWADRIDIQGPLILDGSSFSGEIRLLGAKIKDNLECRGAKLNVTVGNALSADRAKIGGDVVLREGFESNSKIRLLGAKIGGDLSCIGAKLKVTEGCALSADRVEVGGGVFLRAGFESSGGVRLLGAKIKRDLDCVGAKLIVKKGIALDVDSAKIGGYVFLRAGFESNGDIRLVGAQIGGDLDFLGAKVDKVYCRNLRLAGDLCWMGIQEPSEAYLNLTGATVKNLHDDRESWPHHGHLILDGLAYKELTLHPPPSEEQIKDHSVGPDLPLNAEERIEWLMLQPSDCLPEPQPWMQLRDLLERKGDRKGAKYVLFRFRCLQAEKSWILWQWLKILFARLEENPLRILYTITLAVFLGSLVFGYAGARGALTPTEPEAYKAFTSGKPMPAAYPTLNPVIYTLENAVPLMKLGQDEKWAPDRRYTGTNWFTNYWFLMWWRWLLILSGWVQATVLAAALSGRFKP